MFYWCTYVNKPLTALTHLVSPCTCVLWYLLVWRWVEWVWRQYRTHHSSSGKYFRIPKDSSNNLDEKIFRPLNDKRFSYSKVRLYFRIKTKERLGKRVKNLFLSFSGRKYFSSRWSEESLRILKMLLEQWYLLGLPVNYLLEKLMVTSVIRMYVNTWGAQTGATHDPLFTFKSQMVLFLEEAVTWQ